MGKHQFHERSSDDSGGSRDLLADPAALHARSAFLRQGASLRS